MLQGDVCGMIEDFLLWKGGVVPNFDDSLLFLISEVGELADAVVSNREAWARNDKRKIRSVKKELADVYMMLLLTANAAGISLHTEMLNNFESTGYYEGQKNA